MELKPKRGNTIISLLSLLSPSPRSQNSETREAVRVQHYSKSKSLTPYLSLSLFLFFFLSFSLSFQHSRDYSLFDALVSNCMHARREQ